MQNDPTQRLIQVAISQHQAGLLLEAERIYRDILVKVPDHPDALHLLGLILYQRGNDREAGDLIGRSLIANPLNYAAHCNLGLVVQRLGHQAQAVACYRKALSIKVDYAEAFQNLALVLYESGKSAEALALLDEADKRLPEHAGMLQVRAYILNQMQAYSDALAVAEKALRLDSQTAKAHFQRGLALCGLGRDDAALPAFETARHLAPDLANAHFNAAKLLYSFGEFEKAIAACDAAINADPALGKAYGLRLGAKKITANDPFMDQLKAMEPRIGELDLWNQVFFYSALGQAHEQLKEFDSSFAYYAQSAKIFREIVAYDFRPACQMFAMIRGLFTAENFARLMAVPGTDSTVPIFIVGMPRSGTTLVEQILASHSRIAAGGELELLDQALHGFLIGGKVSYQRARASVADQQDTQSSKVTPAIVAQRYLSGLEKFRSSPSHAYVTDKMPVNFLRLGFIRAIFPNAKIIHCRRDPLDNCVSIFFTQFAKGYEWGKDLRELGDYYRNYIELMAHWRTLLPLASFYEVDYESLVAEPEDQIRKLLDYVGVPWEPQCQHFHKTQRQVATASAAQVRKPVYGTSVKRGKPYVGHLGALIEALGPVLDLPIKHPDMVRL